MNIYLVGFMGSGKTTAGRKLAAKMNRHFIDLDKQIEDNEEISIAEIFATYGEAFFRQLETKNLKNLGSSRKYVISTGGGAPCHSDNMEFMNQTGITIYLKMEPEQLLSRLKKSKNKRPLLTDMNKEQMREFILAKLAEREPYYKKASITVDGFSLNINKLAEKIQQEMQ